MLDWKWPICVFALVGLVGLGARQAIGHVYSSGQAVDLLQSLSQSGLYLGSATATASATTLALMLTLVGMVRRSDEDFNAEIYRGIQRIATLSTASLVASLLLLLVLVFPVSEFDGIPAPWYPTLYQVLFGGTILVVALLAATVALVYRTVRHVIARVTPGEDA
ncbi:hypothetical protein [Qipengyuania sp.]|uniref:hypothetical protein n=1 Tax=Qipengyuania sp. TaxID=2004515 RepID=UPI0035C85D08